MEEFIAGIRAIRLTYTPLRSIVFIAPPNGISFGQEEEEECQLILASGFSSRNLGHAFGESELERNARRSAYL